MPERPAAREASYRPCYCGADCNYAKAGEPCWGQVWASDEVPDGDEGYSWIHACEGHFDEGMYDPPPATQEP